MTVQRETLARTIDPHAWFTPNNKAQLDRRFLAQEKAYNAADRVAKLLQLELV